MTERFDRVAALYDAVRPGYPAALFDDLLRLAAVPSRGRVLEVGAGTGQATVEFARRGLRVVALEPGPNLAARARARLDGHPHVTVLTERFEDWQCEIAAFDLVASATAFHWVDPEVGYRKAFEALRSGGWLALFWNRPISGDESDRFHVAIAGLYERWAPHLGNQVAPGLEAARGDERIGESGLFGPTIVRRYASRDVYDARRYTDLLRTYSDHAALPPEDLERLLAAIADLIRRDFHDALELDRATVLYTAPRLAAP